jgi:propionyl-CoA carboxylase alpha chain
LAFLQKRKAKLGAGSELRKILIANRGEIACRVMRTAHRWATARWRCTATPMPRAPHVQLADEAVRIGPPPAASRT